MSARRVRWACPTGEHPGVLGPSRPRKDNICRYCWPCSQKAGKLVERIAPVVERQREQAAAKRQEKAQAQRASARDARAAQYLVEAVDYKGGLVTLDVRHLLRRAWRSDELRGWHKGAPLPKLTVRRSQDKGHVSGHAKVWSSAIVLTIPVHITRAEVEAIVIHEAAHSALPQDAWHDGRWRSAYLRTVREVHGIPNDAVKIIREPTYNFDRKIIAAITAHDVCYPLSPDHGR